MSHPQGPVIRPDAGLGLDETRQNFVGSNYLKGGKDYAQKILVRRTTMCRPPFRPSSCVLVHPLLVRICVPTDPLPQDSKNLYVRLMTSLLSRTLPVVDGNRVTEEIKTRRHKRRVSLT